MTGYTIPYVSTRTWRGTESAPATSAPRLLGDRILYYLGTPIDDGVAASSPRSSTWVENPEAPVSLYLNSPGGAATAMLAIYDAMQFVPPGRAHDLHVGQVVANAAVLLAAGAEVIAKILPIARRPASARRGPPGHDPDLILEADEVERTGPARGGARPTHGSHTRPRSAPTPSTTSC